MFSIIVMICLHDLVVLVDQGAIGPDRVGEVLGAAVAHPNKNNNQCYYYQYMLYNVRFILYM